MAFKNSAYQHPAFIEFLFAKVVKFGPAIQIFLRLHKPNSLFSVHMSRSASQQLNGWLLCNEKIFVYSLHSRLYLITKLFTFPASERNTSEGIICNRNLFIWLKIDICVNKFHKFSFVREARPLVRFRSIQSLKLSLNKTNEFNHGSCLTSDHKQAKEFTVVGLCLNSITFFSLARLYLKQQCLICNKVLRKLYAVTTPMWFRAWACSGRLITSVFILVSEWFICISESP